MHPDSGHRQVHAQAAHLQLGHPPVWVVSAARLVFTNHARRRQGQMIIDRPLRKVKPVGGRMSHCEALVRPAMRNDLMRINFHLSRRPDTVFGLGRLFVTMSPTTEGPDSARVALKTDAPDSGTDGAMPRVGVIGGVRPQPSS